MPSPSNHSRTFLENKDKPKATPRPESTARRMIELWKRYVRMSDLFDRTALLRCLAIGMAAMVGGAALMWVLVPLLSSDVLSQLLAAHLPGDTLPLLAWLRLCASRLPFYILLTAIGFTSARRWATVGLLIYRGLSDGAIIGLLLSPSAGIQQISADFPLPSAFPVAFTMWLIMDLAARTYFASEVKRCRVDLQTWDGRSNRDLERLMRYCAIALGSFAFTFIACGMYVGLLCL